MIALFAVAALTTAQADPEIEAEMSRFHIQCMATATTQERRLACLMDETWRQDDRLNAVYQRMRANTPEARWTNMRDTQRAWIRVRDDYCATARRTAGGGIRASLAFADCYLNETVERRVWLENQGNRR
ncbi:lysozyme inhibitor LprI family protein [Brevundimonas sp.]|uniref:lysozyme inhibitor LprI family protein n=1 Tax=Brevundimonas sp. TaxID=1871086 RepID=UPI003D150BFF